jgi:hypothetical protein
MNPNSFQATPSNFDEQKLASGLHSGRLLMDHRLDVTIAGLLDAYIRSASKIRFVPNVRTGTPCARCNSCIVHAMLTADGDSPLGSGNQLVTTEVAMSKALLFLW